MKLKVTFLTFFIVLMNISCSVQNYAMKKITAGLAGGDATVFTADDDPEMIGNALPFTIKMYETLLSKDSTNPMLYLITGKLLCLYSQGFVLFPSDTLPDSMAIQKKAAGKRAKKLFLRGRDYVLKGIEIKHPGFTSLLNSSKPESAIQMTNAGDSSFLYWAGISWMGAISSDRSDLGLGMTTKKAILLLKQLSSINENYNCGALDEFFCTFYSSAPKSFGGDTSLARVHFNRAVPLADNSRVSLFVAGALSLSRKSKNKDEFELFLNNALSIDINAFPSMRLQNTLYKERAKWLLDHSERYFPAPAAPEVQAAE